MKKQFFLFSFLVGALFGEPAANDTTALGGTFGPLPDFKSVKIGDSTIGPFQTKDVSTAKGEPAVQKPKDGTADARSLLADRKITAVTWGLIPTVLIDGEVFSVGDELVFPDGKGGVESPGSNVRLRLKRITQDGRLVIAMTSVGNEQSPVEFEQELPKELKDLLSFRN